MLKQGDVREDGFVFRCKYKNRSGNIKEHWLSPEVFAKWKESRNLCNRINYYKNIEAEHRRSENYRVNNKEKTNAKAAKRRAAKRNAVPPWLSKEHNKQIESFYWLAKLQGELCDMPYEVDHIEPLQGKDVCGLHVPWNLQIIPMRENRSKGIKRGIQRHI
jgi:hypothetical protein